MTRRISPQEAHELMRREGYTYVDVRSVPEYEASHPEGAVNVPLMHRGPAGFVPNPDFLQTFTRAFPPGSRVVIGCQGGNRSIKAAALLEEAGYDEVVECRSGFGGARDEQGRVVETGWCDAGLPCASGPDEERGWEAIRGR